MQNIQSRGSAENGVRHETVPRTPRNGAFQLGQGKLVMLVDFVTELVINVVRDH